MHHKRGYSGIVFASFATGLLSSTLIFMNTIREYNLRLKETQTENTQLREQVLDLTSKNSLLSGIVIGQILNPPYENNPLKRDEPFLLQANYHKNQQIPHSQTNSTLENEFIFICKI